MALPDFVILGAMKCGTSTLAAQLGAQEGVFMSTPKEPNFFSDDDVYAQGLDWYQALFDGAEAGALRGEASTHYTKLPTHPHTLERMRMVLEAPRLVYMIRNPVARAVSHYIHEWTEGRMSADPVSAFETHPELIDYGRYAMQITPFAEAYGPEAILVTSLERLTGDPEGELVRIGAHIGMGARAVWQADLGAKNVSSERIRKLPLHGLLVGNPVATALRRSLVPKALRTRIRQARSFGDRPELPDNLKEQLHQIFAEDQAALMELGLPGAREALS
ncbi:sulfotransferase [Gymnodinialimonas sp. 2305UL16-5]|uniref:sulfotransferase family protein n=1 Tax=Gymnodinialimonas mytili TaxID=3126503 RepID=UPI0030A10234